MNPVKAVLIGCKKLRKKGAPLLLYLIAAAWGYDPQNPPRLDRTCFSTRKHE